MCEHDNVVDIDLHRYKCNDCGQIQYYSSAAKNHYEDGDDSCNDILFNND